MLVDYDDENDQNTLNYLDFLVKSFDSKHTLVKMDKKSGQAVPKSKCFLGAKINPSFVSQEAFENIAPPHKMLAIFLNIPIQQRKETSSAQQF